MAETTAMSDLFARVNALIENQRERVALQQEMKRIYFLEWNESLSRVPDYIKMTRDTQPMDAINWAVDVLCNKPPSINVSVPRIVVTDKEEEAQLSLDYSRTGSDIGEILGRVARTSFDHNDARRLSSLQRNLVTSMFLYDMGVVKVADLRRSAQWKGESYQSRNRFPFAMTAVDPTLIYYETDDMGVSGILHRYLRPLRDVKAIYKGADIPETFPVDGNGYVVFCEWWERDKRAKWIERTVRTVASNAYEDKTSEECVLEDYADNELKFIPMAIKIGRGVEMFEDAATQIMPILYGGWKSNIFYRANLFLSVVSTLALAEANPQFTLTSASGTKTLNLDLAGPNVYSLQTGEVLQPLKIELSRGMSEALNLMLAKSQQTTVSPVIAGQAPAGVTAAAAINLLAQGGKLNVTPAQEGLGQLFINACEMIFEYIKIGGEDLRFVVDKQLESVAPENIPNWMEVEVQFHSDLPQDRAQLINTAIQAWKSGFISHDTAYDLAGIEDKLKERERIDAEKQMAVPEDQAGGPPQEGGGLPPGLGAQGMPGQTLPGQEPAPVAGNPQANNPILDMMNAQQNAGENPMERME